MLRRNRERAGETQSRGVLKALRSSYQPNPTRMFVEDGYADQSCLPDVILRLAPIAACPLHLGRLVLPQLPDLAPTSMDATDRQVSSAPRPCLPPGHTLVRTSSSGAPRGASTAEDDGSGRAQQQQRRRLTSEADGVGRRFSGQRAAGLGGQGVCNSERLGPASQLAAVFSCA